MLGRRSAASLPVSSLAASLQLRNNFAWHFRAKFREGFRDANEIEFVFLSLAEPALLVAPRPHFSLNDIFQIGYWNGETENFLPLRSSDETLVTLVLRELDIQFA